MHTKWMYYFQCASFEPSMMRHLLTTFTCCTPPQCQQFPYPRLLILPNFRGHAQLAWCNTNNTRIKQWIDYVVCILCINPRYVKPFIFKILNLNMYASVFVTCIVNVFLFKLYVLVMYLLLYVCYIYVHITIVSRGLFN